MQSPTTTPTRRRRRESYTEALNAAIHRYNALLPCSAQRGSPWIKIRSQPIPRSSRIHVYKRSISNSETAYKVVLECLTQSDRQWTLSGWHSLLSNPDTRKLWDHMVDRVQVVEDDPPLSPNVLVTRRIPNDKSGGSNVLAGADSLYIEKTSRKKERIRHISAATSATSAPFAAYDIRMSPDDDPGLDSRVTLYYQLPNKRLVAEDVLESYIVSLVTGPISVLALHGAPPYIVRQRRAQVDDGIFGVCTAYHADRHEWDLQYRVETRRPEDDERQPQAPSSSSCKVGSIQIKQTTTSGSHHHHHHHHHQHHQSASWDHQSSLQLASSLRHRKNSFMASSLLITPSYAASMRQSPKLIPSSSSSQKQQHDRLRSDVFSSSYTFGTQMHEDIAENRAATAAPDVMVELDHTTWAPNGCVDMRLSATFNNQPLEPKLINQFSQFCVRCYRQRRRQGGAGYRYFVTLHHPTQFIRTIATTEGNHKLQVNVQLKPGELLDKQQQQQEGFHQMRVNGKEWPFRLWEGRAWSSSGDAKVDDDSGSDSELADDGSSSSSSSSSEESSESNGGDASEHGVFASDMDGFATAAGHRDTTTGGSDMDSQDMIPPLSLEPVVASAPITESPIEHSTASEQEDKEDKKEEEEEPAPISSQITVPDSEPTQLVKMHTYFDSLLQRSGWSTLQTPEAANLFVRISKLDVSGHPVGAFLSESVWRECSIWDVKAVVSCLGARKFWDSTFEDASLVHHVSPTCSIWHFKTKGFWTVSPRDYVAFAAAYVAPGRIDFCATSCISETFGHVALPKHQSGHVRARLDLWAWRLERNDSNSATVKLINQANPQGWIPSYIPNSLSGHHPDIVMHAHQYFNKHGAPPDLVMLQHGSLVDISFDQHRQSLRAEYVRSAEPMPTATATTATSTKAEIRLDGRRQHDGQQEQRGYNVVIDPPPSRVHASTRNYDPFGWWLEIEHDEEHIIPQRGKILVLIKPSERDDRLVVNGVPTDLCKGASPTTLIKCAPPLQDKPHQVETSPSSFPIPTAAAAVSSTAPTTEGVATTTSSPGNEAPTTTPVASADDTSGSGDIVDSIESIVETLPVPPKEHAQRAMGFLAKMVDQQFGWNNVSDKNGMQISKRQGTSKTIDQMVDEPFAIPEPSLIVKASKVIEGFSVEEVVSVVTDMGPLRKQYDESVEEIEPLMGLAHGCALVRQVIKGGFFFKSREVYVAACTAHEKITTTTNTAAKRVIYIEASIPNFPVPKSSKRQQALFCLSGWILEAIDPYTTTTNHPIPSTRATFVATLDLGASVPAYFSNQLALGLPKKIKALETLLKTHGPPPYLTKPLAVQGFASEQLSDKVIKHLYPDHSAVEWAAIDKSYDQTHCLFKTRCTFRLPPQKKSTVPAARSNLSVSLQRSQAAAAATATANNNSSSNASKRRKSVTISADTSSSNSSSSTAEQDMVLIHAVVDLRNYSKGYEVSAKLMRLQDDADVSSLLYARVSELAPEPSHLVANTSKIPQKHAIELYLPATSSLSRLASRDCVVEMTLAPVQEESLNKRGTRLTVSGVLGDEDSQWCGLILLNGREIEAAGTGECVANADTPETETTRSDDEDHVPGSPAEDAPATMGGGVVAAALGGVSAGVNDIRARMMLPFRSASNPFLSIDDKNAHDGDDNDDDDDDDDRFSSPMSSSFSDREEPRTSPRLADHQAQLRHQQRRMRSQSDVAAARRKRSNSVASCVMLQQSPIFPRLVGFLVMLVFVMILVGILVSPATPIDTENMHVRYLWSMPWFGGWHIQVLAVQR